MSTTAIRIGSAVADLLVYDSGVTTSAAQMIMDRLVDSLEGEREYILIDLLDELRLCIGARHNEPEPVPDRDVN